MGIISEVKCGRCDRRYSGFRSRCPYCGARRNKRGKHADDDDNSRGKLIVGILLLLILIVAIVVLIVTSLGEKNAKPKEDDKDTNIVDINDDEITTVPGDITLYQGNQLSIYYDENTWSLTRIGKLHVPDPAAFRDLLGDGAVEVTFWLEWDE